LSPLDPWFSKTWRTVRGVDIVLGIDNLVFIAFLTNRLPAERRPLARKLGLALGTRLILLAALAWIVTLTQPLLSVMNLAISWRDIILITGGCSWNSSRPRHSTHPGDSRLQ
jgi:predicted tellurium resistance membrane protein TerC